MPFLMFCGEQHGKAEAAIGFYCSIFEDARVVSIDRYGSGDTEPEGTVRVAEFEISGHRRLPHARRRLRLQRAVRLGGGPIRRHMAAEPAPLGIGRLSRLGCDLERITYRNGR